MSRTVDLLPRPSSAGAAPVGPAAPASGVPLFIRLQTLAPVLALVAASVVARLPFLTRPLSPDEGGFLMVAGQWSPGTSLYGNYWVDRPPLLVTVFQLANLLGGPVGLRLVGIACVATSVLFAALLARAATRLGDVTRQRPGRVVFCAAAAATVFLSSPLFGASEVDGELVAVPFVLAGLTAVITAQTASRRALTLWAAAGALAVAAVAVKQNMFETFVAAAVLLVATARSRPRVAVRAAGVFAGGAVVATAALLGWAELHGTTPAALWDAVVSFRFQASSVIAASAPSTTSRRALGVAGAFVGSGALVLVLVALVPALRRHGVRRPTLLTVLATAVLGWEAVAAAAGGSFWLHYLVGTVPALVLAATLAASTGGVRRSVLTGVLGYAGVVAAAGVATTALSPIGTPASDLAVEHYLSKHAAPGDTGVVAFGDPALLEAAHLESPYPELWSLPVRVRDPQLTELTGVLTGPDRPTWVVVDGSSLATWGVDPLRAQPVLEREYRIWHSDGDWHIYHLRTDSQ